MAGNANTDPQSLTENCAMTMIGPITVLLSLVECPECDYDPSGLCPECSHNVKVFEEEHVGGHLTSLYQETDMEISFFDYIKKWYSKIVQCVNPSKRTFIEWYYSGGKDVDIPPKLALHRTDYPTHYFYTQGSDLTSEFREMYPYWEPIPDGVILPCDVEWRGEMGLHPHDFFWLVVEWLNVVG